MDEDELEELRQRKAEQLQEEGDESGDREEERRESLKQKAYQYMTQDAISRLGNIRAAQPQLADKVTSQIARLGELGQLKQVDDNTLKQILKELQDEKQDTGNISFRR
ncbi:hypothetical protein GLU26_01370 [Nanohaloarchaea archaeon]|nr:hypothetical protein [Candidatus Nanohaloarchaea archaeon]